MEDLMRNRWMVSEEELDDDQYNVRVLKDNSYLIEGCAGSGKTVLALHKAKEIQDLNKGSYLVIVYTLTLKTFIQDGITTLGLDPDRVCNIDQLENMGFKSADYIIVDEIQDFTKEQIERLKSMANKHIIVFGDDAQQLYGDRTINMEISKVKTITHIQNHITLKKNYRLTVPIAKFAEQITGEDRGLVKQCVKQNGEKPLLIKFKNYKEELDYIAAIITNQGWSNVGIIVRNNIEVRKINDYYDSIGFNAEYKYYNLKTDDNLKNSIDFYNDLPKIMTYHSSKGLQFENVFLPFCSIDTGKYNFREALYVAATRATENLFISYNESLSPFLEIIDQDLYDYKSL